MHTDAPLSSPSPSSLLLSIQFNWGMERRPRRRRRWPQRWCHRTENEFISIFVRLFCVFGMRNASKGTSLSLQIMNRQHRRVRLRIACTFSRGAAPFLPCVTLPTNHNAYSRYSMYLSASCLAYQNEWEKYDYIFQRNLVAQAKLLRANEICDEISDKRKKYSCSRRFLPSTPLSARLFRENKPGVGTSPPSVCT